MSLDYKKLGYVVFLVCLSFFLVFAFSLIATYYAFGAPPFVPFEVLSKRDLRSRTYQIDDTGKNFRTEFFSDNLFVDDGSGNLLEKDFNFVSSGNNYLNRYNVFSSQVPNNFNGSRRFGFGTSTMVWIPVGGNSVAGQLQNEGYDIDGLQPLNIIFYPNAWTGTDVKYKNVLNGLETLIIAKDATAPTSYSFRLVGPNARTILKNGVLAIDQLTVSHFRAFDANGAWIPLSLSFSGNVLTISYNPAGFQYPITIDPTDNFYSDSGNPAANVVDGSNYKNTLSSWAQTVNATTADGNLATALNDEYVDCNGSGASKVIVRGIWAFKTSSIGSGSTINSATFSFIPSVIVNNNADHDNWLGTKLNASTTIANSDYNFLEYWTPTTTIATATAWSGYTANASTTITLNATGLTYINKTGVTILGDRCDGDINSALPSSAGNVKMYFADNGTNIPRFNVNWTAAVAAASSNPDEWGWFMLLLRLIGL